MAPGFMRLFGFQFTIDFFKFGMTAYRALFSFINRQPELLPDKSCQFVFELAQNTSFQALQFILLSSQQFGDFRCRSSLKPVQVDKLPFKIRQLRKLLTESFTNAPLALGDNFDLIPEPGS